MTTHTHPTMKSTIENYDFTWTLLKYASDAELAENYRQRQAQVSAATGWDLEIALYRLAQVQAEFARRS